MDKIVILSDQQCRFDDRRTERSVNAFLKYFKPDTIVNNGDLIDFEALSNFRKTLQAEQSVWADWLAARNVLRHQRQAVPKADIILIEGNHEERLTRYLIDNAKALSEIPKFKDIDEFLQLKDFDVQYIGPYGKGLNWHSVFLHHGSRVSGISAYSARSEYLEAGTSGVSGHTHRLGSHYFRDRSGAHVWFENGCLCNINGSLNRLPPDGRGSRVRNVQQGFTFGYYDKRVGFNLYQVSITNHKFIVEGKVYTP